jgi:hypothetical protein
MKGIVSIVITGLLVAPVASLAQEWKAYSYPDPGFAIQFPADPTVEKDKVKTSLWGSLPVTHYSVRQGRIEYTVSVVDYSTSNADALTTIAATEKTLGASGKVTVAIGARVNRSFGRELSINGNDGSRSAIAIFFVDKHLYTVLGKALPPNAIEQSGDAIRFEESLQFIGVNSGYGGIGVFGGLFGRGASGRSAGIGGDAPVLSGPGGGGDGAGVNGGSGGGSADRGGGARFRGSVNPRAEAACAGKSVGDAVQLETPNGPVAATCTLIARPNTPPNASSQGPPPAP